MAKDKMGLYLVDGKGNCHELKIVGFEYDAKNAGIELRVANADANILGGLLYATYHLDELPPEENDKNETE